MRPDGHRRRTLSPATFLWLATLLVLPVMNGPMNEALAAGPSEINFQGLLVDSGGAVVNGLVDLDFELFDAASAGTSLWSESQLGVSVLDGVYNVALGSITPIDAAVLAGGNAWLEITIEGETLTPRQKLLAVPYALRSAEADHATSVDSATVADSATTADFATTADTAGNLPLGALEAIYSNFPFDGADPPNDDPREGLADTDNDGIENFIDPDNDNDGIPDVIELGNSDINLVTPTISSVLPSIADDIFATPVTVTGTGFIAGQTVAVGLQSPTPTNITPTSFDIVLAAQPAPTSTSLIVTRPNSELASSPFSFELTLPSISSITPSVIDLSEALTIDVVGSDFLGAFTVTLDGNPILPSNVTPTSFSFDVVAPAFAASLPIVVTLSNGQSASDSLSIQDIKIAFTTSTEYAGDFGGVSGGDTLCASRASAAGLPGIFLAWLSDSSGGPDVHFTPSASPYVRVDHVIVASDFADLSDGDIQKRMHLDEFGSFIGTAVTWTNVPFVSNRHCNNWTSAFFGVSGNIGVTSLTGAGWTSFGSNECNLERRLYCFEQ